MADSSGAFAAYITGNVASNLIGRLVAAAVADRLGLATSFYVFAILNLVGALLVYFTIRHVERASDDDGTSTAPLAALRALLRAPISARLSCAVSVFFSHSWDLFPTKFSCLGNRRSRWT